MRGKVSVVCNPLEVGIGSPPPMRGKAVGIVKSKSCARITPAYAGKSQSRGNAACVRKDHPRLCGEKLSDAVSSLLTLGSPPPMRGKDGFDYFNVKQIRITPAYAGKSIPAAECSSHPLGSPPPMRGKVLCCGHAVHAGGITPAYAGKSPTCDFCGRGTWDHPRLCGEKKDIFNSSSSRLGSPPPMRGKAQVYIGAGVTERITPAYAGKSLRYSSKDIFNSDHPRLCGEKIIKSSFISAGQRITPAYAGKRQVAYPLRYALQDHPRLCGEKAGGLSLGKHLLGSPPPMRGKGMKKF